MSEHPEIVRVRVYADSAGEFRFTGYAANERAIVVSSEGYTNEDDAVDAAHAIFPNAELSPGETS